MNTKLEKDQDRDKEKAIVCGWHMQNHSLCVGFLSFASPLHQLSLSFAPKQAKFKRLIFFSGLYELSPIQLCIPFTHACINSCACIKTQLHDLHTVLKMGFWLQQHWIKCTNTFTRVIISMVKLHHRPFCHVLCVWEVSLGETKQGRSYFQKFTLCFGGNCITPLTSQPCGWHQCT